MQDRYCSPSPSTEILARSTFCVRAKINSTSSGPSKPSRATTSASSSRGTSSEACQESKSACGTAPAPALLPPGSITTSHRWINCASSREAYTDSGVGAQNLGKTSLCRGHVQRLLLPDGGAGPLETGERAPR